MACRYLTSKKTCSALLNSAKIPEKIALYCSDRNYSTCPRYRFVQAKTKNRLEIKAP